MNMPCPCRVDCPGTDSPFANLTTEAPDQIIFIGYSWGNDVPQLGWNFGDPINNPAFCDSPVSQQDADLCAGRAQVGCLVGDCGPGGSGPTIPWSDQNNNFIDTFLNEAAFCTVFCQDGLPFTYTVKAGLFRGFSQTAVDKSAISYACQLANLNSVCFGSITNACLNQNYLSVISVTGGFAPYSIARIGGTLPPGVGFVQDTGTTAFLSGIPTASGSFTFTLRAVDTKGNFMQKDFTVFVLAISNAATMTFPAVGTFYNQQLLGAGGVPPYTFSNPIGLPGGLTLQADGFVVGNPIAPIGTGFTCTMNDAAGNSCPFTITYLAACAVFTGLVWPNPPSNFVPPGNGNPYFFNQFTTPSNSIEWSGSVTAVGFPPPFLVADNESNVLTVPSGGLSCKCAITVKSVSGSTSYRVFVSDPTFTTFYMDTGIIGAPVLGTTNFLVVVPAGVPQIVVGLHSQMGNVGPFSGALDFIAVFS